VIRRRIVQKQLKQKPPQELPLGKEQPRPSPSHPRSDQTRRCRSAYARQEACGLRHSRRLTDLALPPYGLRLSAQWAGCPQCRLRR
jgi:hypothetical protein